MLRGHLHRREAVAAGANAREVDQHQTREDDQRQPRVRLAGCTQCVKIEMMPTSDQTEQRDHEDALKAAQVQTGRIHDTRQAQTFPARSSSAAFDDDVAADRAHVLSDDRRDADAFAEMRKRRTTISESAGFAREKLIAK